MSQRVAVVGFGYIGACIGAVLAEKRYQVVGIDPRTSVVEAVRRGEIEVAEPGLGDMVRETVAQGLLEATTSFDVIATCDIVIITVGTPLGPEDKADTSQVLAACRSVADFIQRDQLVMLKSTVPPGTTEDLARPILESSGLQAGQDFFLAFCPERLAEGRALHELQVLPVVVGGVDESSTERAASFWEDALSVQTIRVGSARAAELSKLADNLWIDVSIGVGNELAKLSQRLDVDVLEVIEAANSLPKGAHNVNILLPSVGVGGSCLTKDPWFVQQLGRSFGLELELPKASRTVNEGMPAYTYELIESELEAEGIAIEDATIAVLGVAFKNNTGDTRFSPVRELLQRLEKSGCELRIHDPLVTVQAIQDMVNVESSPTVAEAIRGADCVAFTTGHDAFRRVTVEELAAAVNPGCLVLDGRMYFDRPHIAEMRAAGLRYRGIGR